MAQRYPYTNAANKYAREIAAGRRPACQWVVLACQRHLDDLKKEREGKRFAFRFNKDEAERACKFIHALPHTKGKWAQKRENIKLSPWQLFIVAAIFGWRRKKDGNRRFRDVYLEIPRKNGKSVLAAAIGLYCFAADREFGAEVYSGATTEKQAWEVFRPARLMALRTPALQHHFGIDVNASTLSKAEDGSRFEPLIGNPGDGASPSCAIVDEYHEHDKPDLYDTMITGMGAREHPLALVITTAGSNIAGPCYEKRTELQKVLQGVFKDDQMFGVIYSLDEDDDWTTEAAIRKANPNYGVSVGADYLKAQVKKAQQSPSKQGTTKTKHFNIWVGAREAWLNMESWAKCGNNKLRIEDFTDCPSVLAIDLATRVDMAAASHTFYRVEDDGRMHYYVFPSFWLPEGALETSKNAQRYAGWAAQGLLNLVDGDEVDFNAIQAHIIGDADQEIVGLSSQYQINEFVYDPWQATQLAQSVGAQGATTVEFRNTVQNMSPAMREVEGAIASKRFHHANHPILTWHASNVVAKEDAKENIFPRKEQSENKIDGMIATIMAVGRAYYAVDTTSRYETEELLVL